MSINKEPLTPIERFWSLLKPDQKEVKNIYVYAVFIGLVNLTLPVGIQAIINLIQGGQISTSWVVLIIIVITGIVLTGILQIQQLKITEHLQQKLFTRAAFEFAFRIPKIKIEALYKHYAPELMNRFFDIISIQKGLSKILIDFSTASIQTLFGLTLLSFYHPFFLVFSLVLMVLIYSIFKITSKKGLSTSLLESKNKYNVAHWLEELARTSTSFKLAGETDLPLHRTNESTEKYVEARESHFKILITQYILMLIFKIMVAAGLLIAGSLLVFEQQMNIGQFVAAEIIILLVLSAVEKLVLSLETIYDVLTSLEKIGQVTDLELERDDGMVVTAADTEEGLSVELKEISFRYPEQEKFVFQEASLKIASGEKVLILGDSHSGKTSLLYLLSGLYQVQKGAVVFNDMPIGNLNPNKLRTIIGDCLMEELLFEGTILENITMGRDLATFDNVVWAIEQVGLTDLVNSLPKGYNTIIHPQGKQFSKGIVDLLILARSIADRPKLLLIKDAFTSLVGAERDRIMNFLTHKDNPWTLVIASKDKTLQTKVDRVIKADNKQLTQLN